MSGKGWFDGTMDVISSLAPAGGPTSSSSRPGTPTRSIPSLQRVPSQDALQRSMHNDSGHGKSQAQMIKDLRASNAALSARTAEMEADFMNEINQVSASFQEVKKGLEESLRSKEQQIAAMEERCQSTEARVREREGQLTKMKEETALQRHTITDLKNQLFHLQSELEEGGLEKENQVDDEKWSAEREEMVRELESLREQVKELKQNGGSGSPTPVSPGTDEVMQSWKRLEETRDELSETKARLSEAQKASSNLEQVNKRLVKEHEEEMSKHMTTHAEEQAEWTRKEDELKAKLEELERGSGTDLQELKAQLKERDDTIEELREDKTQRDSQVYQMKSELEKIKAQAESRERYRREEAADLRVLYDAHTEEIESLKLDLDECHREIDEKDEELEEKESELEKQRKRIEELEAEMASSHSTSDGERDSREKEMEQQLVIARDFISSLEKEMKTGKARHAREITLLRNKIANLTASRNDVERRLADVQREKDQTQQKLESLEQNARQEDESRSAKRIQEIVANAARERVDLERQYEAKMAALEKSKQVEMEEINSRLAETEIELRTMQAKLDSTAASESPISRALSFESGATEDVQKLRETVKRLQEKNASLQVSKKQLREAQVALVALDDDRQKMADTYRAQISTLVREKEEIIQEYRSELALAEASKEDSANTAELRAELYALQREIRAKDAALQKALSTSVNADSDKNDEILHAQLADMKESVRKLSAQLDSVRMAKDQQVRALQEKLADRDTTIANLAKTSIAEDQKVKTLREEVESLKARRDDKGADLNGMSRAVKLARDAEHIQEIEDLRALVRKREENERKQSREIETLKEQVSRAVDEAERLRSELNQALENSMTSEDMEISAWREEKQQILEDHQEKIQERDAAIANLVKVSMTQEKLVSDLRARVSSVEAKVSSSDSVGKEEPQTLSDKVNQLKKENEMFATQIIDQDEELAELRRDVGDREAQVASLSQELGNLRRMMNVHKRDINRTEALHAELDEMREANATHREELRSLRRQLREAKTEVDRVDQLKFELGEAHKALQEYRSKVGSSTREDAAIRKELSTALAERDAAERRITRELELVRREQQSTIESLEAQLHEREREIESLRRTSNVSKESFERVSAEVAELKIELDKQSALAREGEVSAMELHKISEEREGLRKEVSELKEELSSLEDDRANIADLKDRLSKAEDGRLTAEQGIIDSYERKISLLKLNKDVTIDGLRKELAEEKGKNTEDLKKAEQEIQRLEMQNKDIKEELEAKLQQKETKVVALEQTLGAQEQLIDNMRAEMDQLQSSMERSTLTRRADIQEMQEEVLESNARSAEQEREITALKMELEEARMAQNAEVARLKEKIAQVERIPWASRSSSRSVAEQQQPTDQRLTDLKERLEQVKWRNTQLQEDNTKLRSRLEKAETAQKEAKNDKYRISALNEEVVNLQGRVEELQEKLSAASAAATAAATASREAPVKRPPISDRSPRRTIRAASAEPPPSPRVRTHSASPKRSSGLRFLKRRSKSREFTPEELAQINAPGD